MILFYVDNIVDVDIEIVVVFGSFQSVKQR